MSFADLHIVAVGDKTSKEQMIAQVRPFNLREHKVIRDLDPSDANRLISVSGMVTRASGIIPDSRCVSTFVILPVRMLACIAL